MKGGSRLAPLQSAQQLNNMTVFPIRCFLCSSPLVSECKIFISPIRPFHLSWLHFLFCGICFQPPLCSNNLANIPANIHYVTVASPVECTSLEEWIAALSEEPSTALLHLNQGSYCHLSAVCECEREWSSTCVYPCSSVSMCKHINKHLYLQVGMDVADVYSIRELIQAKNKKTKRLKPSFELCVWTPAAFVLQLQNFLQIIFHLHRFFSKLVGRADTVWGCKSQSLLANYL